MRVLASLATYVDALLGATNRDALDAALAPVAHLLGFDAHLIVVPVSGAPDGAPLGLWSRHFHHLPMRIRADAIDLLGRASRSARFGFAWNEVSRLVPLTDDDRRAMTAVRAHGIRSGFTMPVAGPGALIGSCSFAAMVPRVLDRAERLVMHNVAPFACEAARRIALAGRAPSVQLSARQRECLVWAARGKTDREIAAKLDVGAETVDSHLRLARERYKVDKRSMLIVRALFDGTLSFEEVMRQR